ncbi:MAG: hypothetical protein ABUS79_21640, partial [Pseudomonadota bacterium]
GSRTGTGPTSKARAKTRSDIHRDRPSWRGGAARLTDQRVRRPALDRILAALDRSSIVWLARRRERRGREHWPLALLKDGVLFPQHVREGRAQRSLALIAGMSSLLGGAEVAYEHYRGSYGQRIMYTPLALSALACGASFWGVRDPRVARTLMPAMSGLLIADGVVGFAFHVRGVARKPGGWRIPAVNVPTGPPLFAPLLLGIGGYLGIVAAFMRRADDPTSRWLPRRFRPRWRWSYDLREGQFQKHMAGATSFAALLSGFEALYSHYKNNFRYKVQWTPIVTAPLLAASALWAVKSRRAARTALPATALLAAANGAIGFLYHARGVKRRPGGLGRLGYNILYGPPIFAPLLFSAAGFLGLLASVMRREKRE